MADDDPRKPTTRRDHILSFVPKAARADALRIFDALDRGKPPLDKSAPPPPPSVDPQHKD